MAKFYRIEAQKALQAAGLAGTFHAVIYDPTTKEPAVLLDGMGDPVAITPDSCVAQEIASSFRGAQTKRQYELTRDDWQFTLALHFSREVLLEVFEHAIAQNPPRIDADPAEGIDRPVLLDLVSANYEQPLMHEGQGTIVNYTFAARLASR